MIYLNLQTNLFKVRSVLFPIRQLSISDQTRKALIAVGHHMPLTMSRVHTVRHERHWDVKMKTIFF